MPVEYLQEVEQKLKDLETVTGVDKAPVSDLETRITNLENALGIKQPEIVGPQLPTE